MSTSISGLSLATSARWHLSQSPTWWITSKFIQKPSDVTSAILATWPSGPQNFWRAMKRLTLPKKHSDVLIVGMLSAWLVTWICTSKGFMRLRWSLVHIVKKYFLKPGTWEDISSCTWIHPKKRKYPTYVKLAARPSNQSWTWSSTENSTQSCPIQLSEPGAMDSFDRFDFQWCCLNKYLNDHELGTFPLGG